MPRFGWMIGLVIVWALGCQQKPSAPAVDSEAGGTAGATVKEGGTPGQDAVKPPLPVLPDVDSFEGNWVLAPHMSGRFVHLALLRLAQGENGEWTITSVANEPLPNGAKPPEVKSAEVKIDGSSIQLDAQIEFDASQLNPQAKMTSSKVNFEGTLRDGKCYGNMVFSGTGGLVATQLLPTDAESLHEYQDSSFSAGSGDFEKATREPDPARGLLKVAKSLPDSALSLEAYANVFNQIARWNLSEAEVTEAVADYKTALERWGPRFQAFAEINVGTQLAQSRKFIDLADAQLTAGEQRLQGLPNAEASLKRGRLNLRIARGLQGLAGQDADAGTAAYADMKELLEKMPYHPEILLAIAEYAEKHELPDEAIQFYLTIVSLPMMERMALSTRVGLPPGDATPRKNLAALWQQKHGSAEGLEAAIQESYDRLLGEMFARLKKDAPPLPELADTKRTVLTEVFTGTGCEACVAADLAVDMVRADFPETHLLVLNYHNHIPAPDPLTSSDSEERAGHYTVQGTPSVLVNGIPIQEVGGYFMQEMVDNSYRRLRSGIDFFVKRPSEIVIEPKAEVVEDKLIISVAVTGIPEAELNRVRLRLAIVEDNVDLAAPNGIRRHAMVVRTMLGGPKGIAAKLGVLKYDLTMPVAELKFRQLAYLNAYEQGKRMKFPEKPAEMKVLRLVAFVQNETTSPQEPKEVLQAASTPVTGEIVYPELKPGPPGEPSTEEPKSDSPPAKSTENEAKSEEQATPPAPEKTSDK